jgi:hypothetical protein
MKGSIWGTSSGTDKKADTGFTFEKLQAGVYKVTPSALLKPVSIASSVRRAEELSLPVLLGLIGFSTSASRVPISGTNGSASFSAPFRRESDRCRRRCRSSAVAWSSLAVGLDATV